MGCFLLDENDDRIFEIDDNDDDIDDDNDDNDDFILSTSTFLIVPIPVAANKNGANIGDKEAITNRPIAILTVLLLALRQRAIKYNSINCAPICISKSILSISR